MRLLITRHGQTVWNLEGRYQGQGDSPLTDTGVAQAQALAARLAGDHLDAIYSSDLPRASRTARIVRGERALPIILDPAWRERNYGAWEGLTRAEIAQRYPAQWAQRDAQPATFAPVGGESQTDVAGRVEASLRTLVARHSADTVLVVTHGGVLWILGCLLLGEDLATSSVPHLGNCGLTGVVFDANGASHIECWDDRSHLDRTPIAQLG